MGVMGFIKPENTSKTVEQNLIVPKDFRHSYAVGQTGCGKTSSYIYSNLQDRIQNNHSIIIYDFKGKEHKAVKYFAHKYNRLDNVISLGVPWGQSVNLIKYFNEKELKNFVISLMSMSKENDYWSQTSSNITCSIWKCIKAYSEIIEAADGVNSRRSFENTLQRFKLPVALTFTEIANIMQSINKIATFVNKVQKISSRFVKMTQTKIEDWYEKYGKDASENKYLELMTKALFFENLVNTELKALEVFKDAVEDNSGSRSSTYQTIILAIAPTFSAIADNKSINDANGIDLVDALNNNKILIINSQELSNTVLANLTGSVLQELSKRVTNTEIQPVSVFIDEAQRVMSPEIDLHTDVLRESKVELFLAFQNISLMQEALGKTKFLALVQNLSTSFHFKNALDFEELETSKLEIFQYYKNNIDKVHTAQPVFLDKDEVFDVEIEYFHLHGIYDQLNIDKKDRDKVIQFNPYLFQKGQIDLVSKDGTVTTIKLRDKYKELETISVIRKVIKEHEATLKHKREEEPEYESLTAAIRAKANEVNKFITLEENDNV